MLTFLVPTYKRIEHLKLMIQCLKVQKNENWEARILFDGDDLDNFRLDLDSRFFIEYFPDGPYNDYGHTPIELTKNNLDDGGLLVMAADDNYYHPYFVGEMLKIYEDTRVKFAYCDMVHETHKCGYFNTEIAVNKIDLGCFVTRTELAKQIKLGSNYTSDGEWAVRYVRTFCKNDFYSIQKCHRLLYVHN